MQLQFSEYDKMQNNQRVQRSNIRNAFCAESPIAVLAEAIKMLERSGGNAEAKHAVQCMLELASDLVEEM